MLRQYGPALIVQCRLAMALAESLVSTWLADYMFAKESEPKAMATKVAAYLSNHGHMMSHSRFISREQARSVGLIIEDLEADQILQDALLSIFHATTLTFSSTPTLKIIENHMGKAFVKGQQQPQPVMVMSQPPARGPIVLPPAIPPGPSSSSF